MTDFHRSLDRALTNVAREPIGEALDPQATGAGGSFLPPGPHPTTAPDATDTRRDGTTEAGLQPVTHLALRWSLLVGSPLLVFAALVWATTFGRAL